jgi:hypothetical protein
MSDFMHIRRGRPGWFWWPERLECYWHHVLQVCNNGIIRCGTCIFWIQIALLW